MPAAAVYVVAIVGTIGAAFAFKHFVFDPHVRPAFERWMDAWKENRRRHGTPVEVADTDYDSEVLMRERRGASSHMVSGSSEDEDDDNHSSTSFRRSPRNFPQRDGVNIGFMRRTSGERRMTSSSIELDNLVAREVREWRSEVASSSGQDLRHRRPAPAPSSGSSVLDESVQPIPFVPLSPRQTHVLSNSASISPATPSSAKRLPTTPASPAIVIGDGDIHNVPMNTTQYSLPSPPQTPTSRLRSSTASLSGSDGGPRSLLPRSSLSPASRAVRGEIDPSAIPAGRWEEANVPITRDATPHLVPPPPTPALNVVNTSPYLQDQNIPSLSQSYPQELDAEHGLELLSPPSSRADSPFSMADISPRPPLAKVMDRTREYGIPSESAQAGSCNVSGDPAISGTPTRTMMNLGNESFDTLSPTVGPRQLALRATGVGVDAGSEIQRTSPLPSATSGQLLDPFFGNEPGGRTPRSVTNSSGSTTYLSLPEEDDDDDNLPLALRRASLLSDLSVPTSPSHSQGLGLTLIPPIPDSTFHTDPAVHPAPLSPTMLSPRSRLAQVPSQPSNSDPTSFRALSDSDLSELEILSDFSASEGELVFVDSPGRVVGDSGQQQTRNLNVQQHGAYESDLESDASWSVAGGSDVGGRMSTPQSPRLGESGVYLTRGGTLRAR